MKSLTSFVCQECGYESPQWLGKCPECGEWNTLREIRNSKFEIRNLRTKELETNIQPKTLEEIKYEEKDRLKTGFSEVDNVLGGGVVKGSVILLAGDPGVGKSTLLLQIALKLALDSPRSLNDSSSTDKNQISNLARANSSKRGSKVALFKSSFREGARPVLYISGEESEEQIKLRAKRISNLTRNNNFLLLSLNNTNAAVEIIEKTKPAMAIIDSIQTMESEDLSGLSGSVGQVRYAASLFIRIAKDLGIPIILVGHVTKEGMVAGPMVLSHMVDTVLFFEGEKITTTRILRSLKNRFGPVDEVGVFTMEEGGIKEISNPQNLFLAKRLSNVSGSVLVVALEGTRVIPIEIQALVLFSKLPFPRRVSSGIDAKRLELLLAILQKHCGLPLATMDVFVNVAGGLKLSSPSVDLGVCLAIFSSFKNIPMSSTVAIAEVGLLGELRSVLSLEKRIKEVRKLGFREIISIKNYKTLSEVIKGLTKGNK